MSSENKIEKLEMEMERLTLALKRTRVFTLTLILFVTLAVLFGASKNNDEIICKKLVILDNQGKVRATLAVEDYQWTRGGLELVGGPDPGPVFSLYNSNGTRNAVLASSNNHWSRLVLNNTLGTEMGSLNVINDEVFLGLSGMDGKYRAFLGYDDDDKNPSLKFVDAQGNIIEK